MLSHIDTHPSRLAGRGEQLVAPFSRFSGSRCCRCWHNRACTSWTTLMSLARASRDCTKRRMCYFAIASFDCEQFSVCYGASLLALQCCLCRSIPSLIFDMRICTGKDETQGGANCLALHVPDVRHAALNKKRKQQCTCDSSIRVAGIRLPGHLTLMTSQCFRVCKWKPRGRLRTIAGSEDLSSEAFREPI